MLLAEQSRDSINVFVSWVKEGSRSWSMGKFLMAGVGAAPQLFLVLTFYQCLE